MLTRSRNVRTAYKNGKLWCAFEVDNYLLEEELKALQESHEVVTIEIKRPNQRKTLSQNRKAWILIDALASTLHMSKSEVYRMVIKDVPGTSATMMIDASKVDIFIEDWTRRGLGYQVEVLCTSNNFATVIAYYGSSAFDKKQMSDFIEILRIECETQGISTNWMEEPNDKV